MFQDYQIDQYLVAARLCLRIAIVGGAMLAAAITGAFLIG
jgi:hypothetical protein